MIKTVIFLLIFFIAGNTCYCQSDTMFFDSNWKECMRDGAKYFRTITKKDSLFTITDSYMINHKPQMVAEYSSVKPEIKEGKCVFYHEDGTKSSEGTYKHDQASGIWILWDADSKDSSIVEYLPDGTRNWIRMSESVREKKVSTYVEEMPEFPGGQSELLDFLNKNLRYPKEAKREKIEGKVVLQFVVDLDGSITNIVVLNEVGGGCTEEAIRVVKMMPKWKPGKQNEDLVRVYFKLPITFKL